MKNRFKNEVTQKGFAGVLEANANVKTARQKNKKKVRLHVYEGEICVGGRATKKFHSKNNFKNKKNIFIYSFSFSLATSYHSHSFSSFSLCIFCQLAKSHLFHNLNFLYPLNRGRERVRAPTPGRWTW